jgi:nitric oxide reductase NorQ protein
MSTSLRALSTDAIQPEARLIEREPYYEPIAGEIALFEAAVASQIPVLLKGPTGCGKTRFIEYVAWKLRRPLITVSCHDDLTASDLVGRYLITNNETVWVDGPLAHAVRVGGICYLDEVVEARKDTTVVIHPLADDRRMLPIEKHAELLRAPKEFVLAMSYNPGYQSVLKELKHSTRQRFVAIEFNYPAETLEAKIVATESGLDAERTGKLLRLAHMTRNLKGNGLDEGASTRLLVHAAKLMQRGIAPRVACHGAIAEALTDDAEMLRAIDELTSSIF